MMSPANIRFPDQQAYEDYAKRYSDYQSQSAMKKGGAVKSKKMASGGEVKGSSGGRGWGMARGSKACKVR
jgi:hypothetical protein